MYELIPQELRTLKQWVAWKLVFDPKRNKYKKIPMNPTDGRAAKPNDKDTWGTFDDAVVAVDRFRFDGIGIMFANGVFGVDIDQCINEHGTIEAYALEIINAVQSYTELSPSGTGIHILCHGTFNPERCRVDAKYEYHVEMYGSARFFTVTGNEYSPSYPLSDCTESIKTMYDKYLGSSKAPVAPKQQRSLPRSTPSYYSMSVDDIVKRASAASNGQKFKDLYNGNWEGYHFGDGSQSCADQAFCNMLAFWCQKDTSLMDAVFQRSGLMRSKWTSRRGSSTYGNKTIETAVADCREVWEAAKPRAERTVSPPPTPPIQENDTPPEAPEDSDNTTSPLFYKLDDTGNAHRFRDINKGDIRYNHIDDHWMFWDGRRWAVDETGEIKRKADAMLTQMQKDLLQVSDEFASSFKKHITKSRSHRGKEAFIVETKHLEGVPLVPAELDRAKNAFNVKNCVISLKTGVTRANERSFLISKIADVSYNNAATCPHWDKFMGDITCHNEGLSLYLQRMVGYCMTASTREQCMFFLWGNGSNGKSTFLDTIALMLGEYASSCQPETVMLRDRNNTARSDLARLKGARLVVTSEPNDGCRLDEGVVKQMTGGTENKLTARFLYGKEFEFTPEFKIVMSTNYKPIIKGTDNGIWRRVRLIPFEAHFSDEQKDKQLPDKLRRELPGILNWAIAGAVGWYKHGLPPCPLVDVAVQEYRSEMDRIQQFTDDCLTTEDGSTLQAARLYHVYKNWCLEQGDRFPISSVKFFGEFKKRFKVRKTSACNEYVGISFNDHGFALSLASIKE